MQIEYCMLKTLRNQDWYEAMSNTSRWLTGPGSALSAVIAGSGGRSSEHRWAERKSGADVKSPVCSATARANAPSEVATNISTGSSSSSHPVTKLAKHHGAKREVPNPR